MKERFGLYLIATDPKAGYEAVARAAVACNVRYLQLRMKDEPRDRILETAHLYRNLTRGTATRFIVNDDLEIAMAVGADGVHLGQSDMSVTRARQSWNTPGKFFGLSTHSMEQAEKAAGLEPDYIGIGPVFPTQTKQNAAPCLGAEEAGKIAERTAITAVAIGGIDAHNLPVVLRAGIENYCVVGAVNNHPDPIAAIRNLQKIWETHVF